MNVLEDIATHGLTFRREHTQSVPEKLKQLGVKIKRRLSEYYAP